MENQIEIFKTKDGKTQLEVRFEGETFWLSPNQIASLFDRDKSVISRHQIIYFPLVNWKKPWQLMNILWIFIGKKM